MMIRDLTSETVSYLNYILWFIGVAMVIVSLHCSRNLNKDRSWYHGLRYCCDKFDHVFVWRNLDFGILGKESSECLKPCLMGHSSRSMDSNGSDNDLNFGGWLKRF